MGPDRSMTGRFAPSPTGPLHFGSLLAATASYLDAHAQGQRWLLRIDDLDTPRNVAGAADDIKTVLDAHGLHWDGSAILQSQRMERYQSALQSLFALNLLFYCRCSRRRLKDQAVYPGSCRAQADPIDDSAVRIRVNDTIVDFDDLIQGHQRCELAADTGDFIVRRRDGLIAYQLATAVDDGGSAIDSVVRGIDLLDNTPRQIYLMRLLDLSPPSYAHIPMLTHPDGSKLSKQTAAKPVDALNAQANLVRTFSWLGLQAPTQAERWSCAELLEWGVTHWQLARIPRETSITV
jgi:glutamyl-Q tRNA(Asp) synthetase